MKIAIIKTGSTFSAIPLNDLSQEQTKDITKVLDIPEQLWNPMSLKMIFPNLEIREDKKHEENHDV